MVTKSRVPFFSVMLFAMMATNTCDPKNNPTGPYSLTNQPPKYKRVGHHYDIRMTFQTANSTAETAGISVAAKNCKTAGLTVGKNFKGNGFENGRCVIKRDNNGVCNIQAFLSGKHGDNHPNSSKAYAGDNGVQPWMQCEINFNNKSPDVLPENVETNVTINPQVREGDSFEYVGAPFKDPSSYVGIVAAYGLKTFGSALGECLAGEKKTIDPTIFTYTSTPPCQYPAGVHINFYNSVASKIRPKYDHGRIYLNFPTTGQEYIDVQEVLKHNNNPVNANNLRRMKATVTVKEDVLCTQTDKRGPIERCRVWEQKLERINYP